MSLRLLAGAHNKSLQPTASPRLSFSLDPLTKEASMATKKEKPAAPETEEQEKPKGKPRNVKNIIPLGSKEVAVYATPRVAKALEEVTEDMTLYHDVRLAQVMEA